MVKVPYCGLYVREFDLQSFYYVHFWCDTLSERYEPFYLPAKGQLVLQLFFFKDGLGIK